jgi:FkbM family methyltransferase
MRDLARRIASRLKRPRSRVKINRRSYRLPRLRRSFLDLNPAHEPWLDRVYVAALKAKAGAFIDIGANQGQTLAKLLSIAPDRQYIGFEPQPACVLHLDEFVRANRLENCAVVPVALSDSTGLVELSLRGPVGDSAASMATGHRPDSFYTQSRLIPVAEGDAILPDLVRDGISLIKIDVEGAELEVLRGLRETVRKHRPFVVFEVLNNYLAVTREALPDELVQRRNDRARQLSDYFDELGFVVFNIRDEGLKRVSVIKPEVSADLSITDYIAVPDELQREFGCETISG